MRLDGNRSLRNLKFYFEIEIFSEYKVVAPRGKYPHRDGNFQDVYILKELISTSKTNG